MGRDDRRSRTVLGLLLLASLTLITLDARPGGSSPVQPMRTAAAAVFGPVQSALSGAVRPVARLPQYFADVHDLRERNAQLATRNAELRAQLRADGIDRERVREVEQMLGTARARDWSLVPARVVALGPAQAFARTVTIDAGRRDGIAPDLTVLNADGLVGRVVRADARTATVLLIVDVESVVGGRLAESMELGFLRGSGELGESAALQLDLVDDDVSVSAGDSVLTWGSPGSGPYVPDVPVGELTAVETSPGDLATTATVRPYVDFTALDVVGVVLDGPPPPRTSLPAAPPYEVH